MDTAVKTLMRTNPRSVDEEVWKAAHLAACGDAKKLDALLRRRGKQVAEEKDKDTSWPPLFFAARSGSAACAKLLLDCGADVQARDPGGLTALHVAAAYSSRNVAAVLLENGGLLIRLNSSRPSPQAPTLALPTPMARGHST